MLTLEELSLNGGLDDCEWKWDKDQLLLRNVIHVYGRWSIDLEHSLTLHGLPYVQGGGDAEYALLIAHWAEMTSPILIETRDFVTDPDPLHMEAGGPFPLWINARFVPRGFPQRDGIYNTLFSLL